MAHLLERISLIPLVAGGLFQLWTGLANIDLWYPLPSFFPTTHYWMAWITMGALVTHVGAKLTTTRTALARHREPIDLAARRSRRRFLTAVGATSSLLVVTVAGQTVAPLRKLALLAPRHPDVGVQGFPVNKSAISAGVRSRALSQTYRLRVSGRVSRPLLLTLEDLRSMQQVSAVLPIACVEGWSASRRWTGVRLRRPDVPRGCAERGVRDREVTGDQAVSTHTRTSTPTRSPTPTRSWRCRSRARRWRSTTASRSGSSAPTAPV